MKHLICIGIDNAIGLIPLGACITGAKQFEEWGKSQGYTTHLFTDEANNVSQTDIFNQINTIVDARNCEQLIIFFSGHGMLKSPSQEIWLLSNASINPNESVNLTASIDYARTSSIPYIVFISDACRVLPSEIQLTGNGSVIFPIKEDNNGDCAIDVLYATRPGSPAFEQSSKINSKRFGLFTQSLIEILNGNYPELIRSNTVNDYLTSYYDNHTLSIDRSYKSLPSGNWHIDTINSETLIKNLVSKKAREIKISLKQSPDLIIQYQNPKPSLAVFDDESAKNLLLATSTSIRQVKSTDRTLLDGVNNKLNAGLSIEETSNRSFKSILNNFVEVPFNTYNLKSSLLNKSELIFDSKFDIPQDFSTGLVISGANVEDILMNGTREVSRNGNVTNVNIQSTSNSQTALIKLVRGYSIPVAIIENFIGELVFDNDRLLTINYSPSKNSHRYEYFRSNESRINFVRAFIASAANYGFNYSRTFANTFDNNGQMNYTSAGNYLRQEKSIDPSLGLYATYAYKQEGRDKDIKSVYRYMQHDGDFDLFDVAMLADELAVTNRLVTPFCPMIAMGWAYRNKFEDYLNPIVKEASLHLVPSLWTTFNKRGTAIIEQHFNQ